MLFIWIAYQLGLNLGMRQSLAVARLPPGADPFEGRTPLGIVKLVSNQNLELLPKYSVIGLAGLVLLGTIGGCFFLRRMLRPVDQMESPAEWQSKAKESGSRSLYPTFTMAMLRWTCGIPWQRTTC
jgi:hypothetical protein